MTYARLRGDGVELLLDLRGGGLPRIGHWGADLGDLPEPAVLLDAAAPVTRFGAPDQPPPLTLLPVPADFWRGRPALAGSRGGHGYSPSFEDTTVTVAGASIEVLARAEGLALGWHAQLTPHGVLRLRVELTNTGDEVYELAELGVVLPVPETATEVLDPTGRWARERQPQRHDLPYGTCLREGRHGRTGPDSPLLLCLGEPGFGFGHGEVRAMHLAWSGDSRLGRAPPGWRRRRRRVRAARARRGAAGSGYEVPLARGCRGVERPRARWPGRAAAPDGAGPSHPSAKRAAGGAQHLGSRLLRPGPRDWFVDPERWPDGLHPLFDRVRSLGLQCGLWVEPEMISPDSDLHRAHPDWVLGPVGRQPRAWRFQQVLDLVNPEAYAYVLSRLDALVREYQLDYLKWDHNRDLVDAGHGGRPAVHRQTQATYRLLDELRDRHPQLEIESCSSGGARVDLGILARTDRVWASDTNDALERQTVQRWTGQLLPPELVGSHIGAPTAHQTGRTHSLSFRFATAAFGHLGLEWDLTTLDDSGLAELASAIAWWKSMRGLLHTGRVVRVDHPDPAALAHGVIGPDEALFCYAQLTASLTEAPGRLRLPGLVATQVYEVAAVHPAGPPRTAGPPLTGLWLDETVRLTGAALAHVGLAVPVLAPEQAVLVHLWAVNR